MSRTAWLLVALAAALAATVAAVAGTPGPRMGPASSIRHVSFLGYYDGHKDTYLNLDVSDKAQAAAMHVNYSAKLGASVKTSEEIYLVQGLAAVGQLAVFSSEPGEKTYTPLWHEEIITWKSGVTPQLLVKDDQITELEKKGDITVRETKTVLNCPIVKVGK